MTDATKPMFQIYTKPSKSAVKNVQIMKNSPLAVPNSIAFGIGNKRRKYSDWIYLALQGGVHQPRLNILAQIFDFGEEQGAIALHYYDPAFPWVPDVLASFFHDHKETLRVMIPYLKQGMVGTKKNTEDLTDEERNIMNNGSKMTLADLPTNDRDQIMALMQQNMVAADQEVTHPSAEAHTLVTLPPPLGSDKPSAVQPLFRHIIAKAPMVESAVHLAVSDAAVKGTPVVPSYYATYPEKTDDGEVVTDFSFLRTDCEIDLIGLSTQSDLYDGKARQLDPAVSVKAILVKIGKGGLLKFDLTGMAYVDFCYSSHTNHVLDFHSNLFTVSPATLSAGGFELEELAIVREKNLLVHLHLEMTAYLNIETARIFARHGAVTVRGITRLSDGAQLSIDDAEYADVLSAFEGASIIGFAPVFSVKSMESAMIPDADTTGTLDLIEKAIALPVLDGIVPPTDDGVEQRWEEYKKEHPEVFPVQNPPVVIPPHLLTDEQRAKNTAALAQEIGSLHSNIEGHDASDGADQIVKQCWDASKERARLEKESGTSVDGIGLRLPAVFNGPVFDHIREVEEKRTNTGWAIPLPVVDSDFKRDCVKAAVEEHDDVRKLKSSWDASNNRTHEERASRRSTFSHESISMPVTDTLSGPVYDFVSQPWSIGNSHSHVTGSDTNCSSGGDSSSSDCSSSSSD